MNETDYVVAQELLHEIAEQAARVRRLTGETDAARADLAQAVAAAVDAGVSQSEVARVAGVSRQRVSVMVRDADTVSARVHAQKQDPPTLRVNDPATVPVIPDTPNGLTAGVVSLRERHPYGRQTAFLPSSMPLADVLDAARLWQAGRVYLTGPAPFDPDSGATQAERTRAWALQPLPEGWSHGEHYLADPVLPVCRYVRGDYRVAVMRAASWWGESDAETEVCVQAWERLGRELDNITAFRGAGLADTPATTGRALWLRTVPEGKGYEVMAPELRELVAATAGQGRSQLVDIHPAEHDAWRDFTYMDGRLMYAALTWGMPVGEPTLWTAGGLSALSDAEGERVLRGRGRWRVTATVPHTWSHVGMLMCPDDAGGWCYPDRPGQTFTTWADGAEVWLARSYGWAVELHEGMSWREGKPLNTWRDHLVGVWTRADAAGRNGHQDAALVAKAVRSIILHALGAFATRAHPITRSAPAASNPDVPPGVEVRLVGENLVWQEPGKLSAWSERTAHPEWSATVWARARARITEAALRLNPARVVAFSTDALYVAGGPPEWTDDGKPGAFRSKGTRPGPFTWPTTRNELYRLRDEAERSLLP